MIEPGSRVIIGDSHIGLGDGAEDRIVEWLDRLKAHRPAAVYLNGDVFNYFIGDEKFRTSSVQGFFDKLRELRDEGIEVHYIEGNRDFFVHGSFAEDYVSDVCTRATFESAGRSYFLIHGDMINDRDWPYRFWRQFSKNPVMKLAVRLWPKEAARRLVDRVEKKLRTKNFKHKRRLPVELMEAYGRKRSSEGYDVVVFGHFHHKLELDAGEARVAVLPAWYETGEAIVVSPSTGEYEFVAI